MPIALADLLSRIDATAAQFAAHHGFLHGQDTQGQLKWRTIGAETDSDGERHGGTKVCIGAGGKIVKGPPNLTGATIAQLKDRTKEKKAEEHKVAPKPVVPHYMHQSTNSQLNYGDKLEKAKEFDDQNAKAMAEWYKKNPRPQVPYPNPLAMGQAQYLNILHGEGKLSTLSPTYLGDIKKAKAGHKAAVLAAHAAGKDLDYGLRQEYGLKRLPAAPVATQATDEPKPTPKTTESPKAPPAATGGPESMSAREYIRSLRAAGKVNDAAGVAKAVQAHKAAVEAAFKAGGVVSDAARKDWASIAAKYGATSPVTSPVTSPATSSVATPVVEKPTAVAENPAAVTPLPAGQLEKEHLGRGPDRDAQKARLQAPRHDAFVMRHNQETEKANQEQYQKNRGIEGHSEATKPAIKAPDPATVAEHGPDAPVAVQPADAQVQGEPIPPAPAKPEPRNAFMDDLANDAKEDAKPKKERKGQPRGAMSKAAIERELKEAYQDTDGGWTDQDESDWQNAGKGMNQYVYYGDKLPGEVRDYLEGHENKAKLQKLFKLTDDRTKAGGEDAMHDLGQDRYFELIDKQVGGGTRSAIAAAKKSGNPRLEWLAGLHELQGSAGERQAQSMKDTDELKEGDAFRVHGVPVEAKRDSSGQLMLEDGMDLPEVPAAALGKVPMDKGSLRHGSVDESKVDDEPERGHEVEAELAGEKAEAPAPVIDKTPTSEAGPVVATAKSSEQKPLWSTSPEEFKEHIGRQSNYARAIGGKPGKDGNAALNMQAHAPKSQEEWDFAHKGAIEQALYRKEITSEQAKEAGQFERYPDLAAKYAPKAEPSAPTSVANAPKADATAARDPYAEALAATPSMFPADKPKPAAYNNGDKIEYTGEVRDIAGGKFHVFKYLDGNKKGQEGVTQRGPDGKHPDDGKKAQEWQDQQSQFRKIRENEQAAKPAPSQFGPGDIARKANVAATLMHGEKPEKQASIARKLWEHEPEAAEHLAKTNTLGMGKLIAEQRPAGKTDQPTPPKPPTPPAGGNKPKASHEMTKAEWLQSSPMAHQSNDDKKVGSVYEKGKAEGNNFRTITEKQRAAAGLPSSMDSAHWKIEKNPDGSYGITKRDPSVWHQDEIKKAAGEGKVIPAEVLKDYPDLAGGAPSKKGDGTGEAGQAVTSDPAGTNAAPVQLVPPAPVFPAQRLPDDHPAVVKQQAKVATAEQRASDAKRKADHAKRAAENPGNSPRGKEVYGRQYSVLQQAADKAAAALDNEKQRMEVVRNATPRQPSSAQAGPVSDFGEKIGGARKDVAIPLGPRATTAEPKEQKPAWMKSVRVGQDANSGKWFVYNPSSGQLYSRLGDHATKEGAENAAKDHAVSKMHGAVKEKDGTYSLVRKLSNGNAPAIKGGFASAADAFKWSHENPDEVLNHKFKEPQRPWLDKIERTSMKEHRPGNKNVNPEEFQKAFGFRGGEFGKWNMGDEGQKDLNHAYDALHDMADTLGVPPKALSLGGGLGIAFGARGHGGKNASAAHYEPGKNVFNLTKMRGAGSTAHEWFHALDNYLHGEGGHATEGFTPKSAARPELQAAFKNLVKTMTVVPTTKVANVGDIKAKLNKTKIYITQRLAQLRQDMQNPHNRHPVTPEQLKKFDELADKFQSGDVGPVVSVPGIAHSRTSGHSRPERIRQLNDVYKEATGRSFDSANPASQGHALDWYARDVQRHNDAIAKAEAGVTETVDGPTQYLKNSKDIDASRSSSYWATIHEMGARAFEAYITDKMLEKAGRSPYLVHGAMNNGYDGQYPYPEGEERQKLNTAFDQLFQAIKHEEVEHPTRGKTHRMFSADNPLDQALDGITRLQRKFGRQTAMASR